MEDEDESETEEKSYGSARLTAKAAKFVEESRRS